MPTSRRRSRAVPKMTYRQDARYWATPRDIHCPERHLGRFFKAAGPKTPLPHLKANVYGERFHIPRGISPRRFKRRYTP